MSIHDDIMELKNNRNSVELDIMINSVEEFVDLTKNKPNVTLYWDQRQVIKPSEFYLAYFDASVRGPLATYVIEFVELNKHVFFDLVRREIVILRTTTHCDGVHEYHLNDNIIGNNH